MTQKISIAFERFTFVTMLKYLNRAVELGIDYEECYVPRPHIIFTGTVEQIKTMLAPQTPVVLSPHPTPAPPPAATIPEGIAVRRTTSSLRPSPLRPSPLP